VLAWTIPGAGYLAVKEKKRAAITFVTIGFIFFIGIYVGSIGVIDPVKAWAWYIPQIMFSPVVAVLAQMTKSGAYPTYGKPCDIGQIYTSVAGMLNLLCVIRSVYMAHSGRGEIIGGEEDA